VNREELLKDLTTLLSVLYARGPRTIEEVTACMNGVTDTELDSVVDTVAHVNEWLNLS